MFKVNAFAMISLYECCKNLGVSNRRQLIWLPGYDDNEHPAARPPFWRFEVYPELPW